MAKIKRNMESRPITEEEGRKTKLMNFNPSTVEVTGEGENVTHD